jgi:hypothetical protein
MVTARVAILGYPYRRAGFKRFTAVKWRLIESDGARPSALLSAADRSRSVERARRASATPNEADSFHSPLVMDATEALVETWLRSLGRGEVRHHPGGDVTPDFLLGERIAIEVRRLNVNVDAGDGMEGLEETAISVRKRFVKLLESYGLSTSGVTWAVSYSFRRPVSKWRHLEPAIRKVLDGFDGAQGRDRISFQVERGFKLRLSCCSPTGERYVPAGSNDLDAAGYVVPMVQDNLVHCIAEKSAKVAPHKHKHDEWWLVMPDFTNSVLHVMSGNERPDIVVANVFERVLVIDPYQPTRAIEIHTLERLG